jgi:uncharacterized membrane protein
MYSIIGADGKEYGPVTADQVRSWIVGGRANLQTKVKEVGTDTWKTVADFPEISSDAPVVATGVPIAQVFREAAPLDILSCYERSWTLLKANFWPLIGVSSIALALYCVLIYAQHSGIFFVTPLLGGVLSAGIYYYFLQLSRNQPVETGDIFIGFKKAFLPLFIAGLLVAVFVTVGMICLILPGIYLAIAYAFTNLIIIDKGLGFWEAMEKSRRVITRQWWHMLGLVLLSIPFILLGLAALGVGILVALPLITGAMVYAYEDLCNPTR